LSEDTDRALQVFDTIPGRNHHRKRKCDRPVTCFPGILRLDDDGC
jgi:hypothetical protein